MEGGSGDLQCGDDGDGQRRLGRGRRGCSGDPGRRRRRRGDAAERGEVEGGLGGARGRLERRGRGGAEPGALQLRRAAVR